MICHHLTFFFEISEKVSEVPPFTKLPTSAGLPPSPSNPSDIENFVEREFPEINNEIPDAAVQANPGQEADVPLSVQNNRETRQQQLNLGKHIPVILPPSCKVAFTKNIY